jgi:excisionase family DNA binding protein
MEYTLAEAATATGLNRSTVLRAIKAGKVSAQRLEDRSYRIDAAELARVYPLPGHAQGAQGPMPGRAQVVHEHAQADAQGAQAGEAEVELAVLRVKLEAAQAQLEDRDRERATLLETVEDLRSRLDAEQEERRALQRQLAPPAVQAAQERPVEPVPGVEPPTGRKGLLARLLGR